MENLNIFKGYKNKPDHFEDQLTRSYLTLIEYSPLSLLQFDSYLRQEMENLGISRENIYKSLLNENNIIKEIKTQISSQKISNYIGRLLSVLITDDELELTNNIESTDRKGIIDGLIITNDDFIIAIENKPRNVNVWHEQLSFEFPDYLEFESKAIVLSWRRIIKGLDIIVQNSVVTGIEERLIKDFLTFINENFPYLNPFDNFELCKNNGFLIEKRCNSIMESLDLGTVTWHRGWHSVINLDLDSMKYISVFPKLNEDNYTIHMEMYPADVMSQGRAFYKNTNFSELNALIQDKGLKMVSNFHFSYRASGLQWTTTDLEVTDYINFWKNEVQSGNLGQKKRIEWDDYIKYLIQNKIMSSDDLDDFNELIKQKGYNTLNICPGLCIYKIWSKNDVIDLDNKNIIAKEFKELILDILNIIK